jgi:hypothetical protein
LGPPKDPFYDLKKLFSNRSKEEQQSILNGAYKQLSDFNALQLSLLWSEPEKTEPFFHHLIDHGASIDKLSNKGLNFMHLFLMLAFYNPCFRSEAVLKIFLKLLNYGFNPTKCLCLSNRVLTFLDILILLQNNPKDLKITTFVGNHPIKKTLQYERMDRQLFEKLFITLLCYGVPFHHKHPLQNVTWFSCQELLYKYEVFDSYIKERMKLPLSITREETWKRINYMLKQKHMLAKFITFLETKEHPIGFKMHGKNPHFFNVSFLPNMQLQSYEYLPPLTEEEQIIYFHKSYFFQLISKQLNPFTRKQIQNDMIEQWKAHVDTNSVFIFPPNDMSNISDLYLFSEQLVTDKTFSVRESCDFLVQNL